MENQQRKVRVGECVVFCDPKGHDHEALVTAVWTPTCVNVVCVCSDESKTDPYGRQIERVTSVMHVEAQGGVHGRYWRFGDEPKRDYTPPQET